MAVEPDTRHSGCVCVVWPSVRGSCSVTQVTCGGGDHSPGRFGEYRRRDVGPGAGRRAAVAVAVCIVTFIVAGVVVAGIAVKRGKIGIPAIVYVLGRDDGGVVYQHGGVQYMVGGIRRAGMTGRTGVAGPLAEIYMFRMSVGTDDRVRVFIAAVAAAAGQLYRTGPVDIFICVTGCIPVADCSRAAPSRPLHAGHVLGIDCAGP